MLNLGVTGYLKFLTSTVVERLGVDDPLPNISETTADPTAVDTHVRIVQLVIDSRKKIR